MRSEEPDDTDFARLPEQGDVIEGRYRLDSIIATGGMGVIMRANQLNLDRDVAVKLLHPHRADDPETAARFEREINLVKDLNHPHTIQILDVGRTEHDALYLVMEYLEGRDLGTIVGEEAPLAVGRALDLTRQALDGLAEAHEEGVIHRDLKPSNIFVQRNRRGGEIVKVLDFGIAKSLGTGSALTETGEICGTVEYMPPEALLERDLTASADIYAMGLILAEMLYGGRIFEADSAPKTIIYQLDRELPIPPSLRQTSLESLLHRATLKDPDERFQTADAMLDALDAAEHSMPSELELRRDDVPAVEPPDRDEVVSKLSMNNPSLAALEPESDPGGVESGASTPSSTPSSAPDAPSDTEETSSERPPESLDSPGSPDRAPSDETPPPASETSPEELKAQSERELVGGWSATIVDNLDNSALWAVLGLVGLAMAAGVLAFVFAPGSLGIQSPGGGTPEATEPAETTSEAGGPGAPPDESAADGSGDTER